MKIKILALMLCVITLLGVLPTGSSFAEEKEITIVSCSDFQPKNENDGKAALKRIVDAIKADGVTKADSLFFCGDYTNSLGSLSSTSDGMTALVSAFSGFIKGWDDLIFVQGNHDTMPGNNRLNPSGENDPAGGDYGVFVINNDDYMWYGNDRDTVMRTAQRLIDYLNEKIEMGYTRPIFVLSHLPLHYSMRTKLEGDGNCAAFIYNALDDAAKKGLNIVYLFGHDHSNGWDDYLGGSSVYLKKGDEILIAKPGSKTNFSKKTLNFTYMNAGYTGYYDNTNGSDGTLTATVLKIKGDEITISRYDEKGLHNLKSAGVRNEVKGENSYDPNTTVYTSPQTVKLNSALKNQTPIDDLVQLTVDGKAYNRVLDTKELVDGGKYLLVYTASTDQLVLPKVSLKSTGSEKRRGLELQEHTGFADRIAVGEFDEYLFTFHKSGSNWKISYDEKYLTTTNTTAMGGTVTLTDEGTVFTVGYTTGGMTLTGKNGLGLLYDSCGLIVAKDSGKAGFYLYEYAGSVLDVENGDALVGDKQVYAAKEGDKVTLQADAYFGNSEFLRFEVASGGVTLASGEDGSTTFTMPAGPVAIKAVYGAHTHAYTCEVEKKDYLKEEGVYYLSCACGSSSKGTKDEQTFFVGVEQPSVPSQSAEPSDEGTDDQSGNNDSGFVLVIVGIAGGAVALVAVVAVVIVILKKKKK